MEKEKMEKTVFVNELDKLEESHRRAFLEAQALGFDRHMRTGIMESWSKLRQEMSEKSPDLLDKRKDAFEKYDENWKMHKRYEKDAVKDGGLLKYIAKRYVKGPIVRFVDSNTAGDYVDALDKLDKAKEKLAKAQNPLTKAFYNFDVANKERRLSWQEIRLESVATPIIGVTIQQIKSDYEKGVPAAKIMDKLSPSGENSKNDPLRVHRAFSKLAKDAESKTDYSNFSDPGYYLREAMENREMRENHPWYSHVDFNSFPDPRKTATDLINENKVKLESSISVDVVKNSSSPHKGSANSPTRVANVEQLLKDMSKKSQDEKVLSPLNRSNDLGR